jgi:polysaccharide deacetylase family protein (PEP-CTERM system associated)
MHWLTVDVEDYYSLVVRDKLGISVSVSANVDREMSRLLDLLDELEVSATCFIVGRLAEERPHVVKSIVGRGHEIASHGHQHLLMQQLTPREFAEDLRTSIRTLESIAGVSVRGFRAPAFSLGIRERWAFEIMAEEGVRFDSSVRVVLPFGRRAARAVIDAAAECGITEFPGLAVGFGKLRAPIAGGGGLRLVPEWFTRLVVRLARRTGHSVHTYIHPYDLSVGRDGGPWPPADRSSALSLAWFDWLQRRGRTKVAGRLHRVAVEEARETRIRSHLSMKAAE